jgi:Holliday junction resolvase-like predicted endonuclease
MGGRQSKRIGSEGEREAKRTLQAVGCHIAMSEVSGLAGDDLFIQDPTGKWWSVEVKNTTAYSKGFLVQAKSQAAERYEALQKELVGFHGDMFRLLCLDTFTKNDYFVMWHPRNSDIALDSWSVYACLNGRKRCRHIDKEDGWCL